uniref:Uncharacterized protein n=1 Tax=Rhizophora mucronata TaxID=61149 RepID=A0A2P2JPF5_RHIMU
MGSFIISLQIVKFIIHQTVNNTKKLYEVERKQRKDKINRRQKTKKTEKKKKKKKRKKLNYCSHINFVIQSQSLHYSSLEGPRAEGKHVRAFGIFGNIWL